jgi:quercetin dioxygenase-like cupin family protein
MSSLIICRGGAAGLPTQRRTDTFTGLVFGDPVLAGADGIIINDIYFAPGARTYWHSHERGQILVVLSGSGLICQHGGQAQALSAGDLVWSPPGVTHWHGAAPGTSMLHRAISLGTTTWAADVSDDEYGALVTAQVAQAAQAAEVAEVAGVAEELHGGT